MKVNVQRMDSHLSRIAKMRFNDKLDEQNNLECEGEVFVTNTFLGYDEQNMHRPYLRLLGDVKSIKGKFPCGVTEAIFSDNHTCPKVDYRYNFTNEELAELCTKGLFDNGFKCPDIFVENVFELPMTCSVRAVVPEKSADAPLLFINIDNQYNLETSHESSGYSITKYFEEVKPEDVKNKDLNEVEFRDIDDKDLLFNEETKAEPVAETEELVQKEPELSEEERVLVNAFENIKNRVDDKLVQDNIEKSTYNKGEFNDEPTKEQHDANIKAFDDFEDDKSYPIDPKNAKLFDDEFAGDTISEIPIDEFDESKFISDVADSVVNPKLVSENEKAFDDFKENDEEEFDANDEELLDDEKEFDDNIPERPEKAPTDKYDIKSDKSVPKKIDVSAEIKADTQEKLQAKSTPKPNTSRPIPFDFNETTKSDSNQFD